MWRPIWVSRSDRIVAPEAPPRKILLVEGRDDEHVVRHLVGRNQPMPLFDISAVGGFPKLKRAIPLELNVRHRIAVGILADANNDPQARWSALAYQLRTVDVHLPREIPVTGTIVQGEPRVGIWLMPDNRSSGELEQFIGSLIPEDDPVWPRAVQYVDGIPEPDRKFAPAKAQRARIHAWLATRKEPRKMGEAIGALDLDTSVGVAAEFASWLRRLFGQPEKQHFRSR